MSDSITRADLLRVMRSDFTIAVLQLPAVIPLIQQRQYPQKKTMSMLVIMPTKDLVETNECLDRAIGWREMVEVVA